MEDTRMQVNVHGLDAATMKHLAEALPYAVSRHEGFYVVKVGNIVFFSPRSYE